MMVRAWVLGEDMAVGEMKVRRWAWQLTVCSSSSSTCEWGGKDRCQRVTGGQRGRDLVGTAGGAVAGLGCDTHLLRHRPPEYLREG
jgi:hypothetical protein